MASHSQCNYRYASVWQIQERDGRAEHDHLARRQLQEILSSRRDSESENEHSDKADEGKTPAAGSIWRAGGANKGC